MATVVVVLFGVIDTSSTPAATSVIAASVVSGGTSETAATAVVLPTPNPPAMTIFTGMGAGAGSAGSPRGPASKSMSNLCLLGTAAVGGGAGFEPGAGGVGAHLRRARRRWVWLV